MQRRNERHRVRVLRKSIRILRRSRLRSKVTSGSSRDLLETFGEGLTFSEDEFPDLSENDLVERGRPFAFLEEDEDTNDDGD